MAAKTKTILVIEDEPDTAEMFAEMMRLSGYRVMKTHNGYIAKTMIAHEKPDALILDVMLPGISGLDILRYVRHEPALQSIPVVVVSAKGLASDIRFGLEAGATVYLAKPITFQNLKEAMAHALQSIE